MDVDHFTRRLLADCLGEATRGYWLRRAAAFEDARPRPSDYNGRATLEELRRRWRELTAIANACRARAEVAPLDDVAAEVDVVWREAS